MTPRWYICEYRQDGIKYGSDIYANSWAHARRLAKLRGIGEVVLGEGGRKRPFYPFPSELMRRRELNKCQALEAVHGVTFLAFLILKGGRASIDQVLGDHGFLHESIHAVQFGRCGRSMAVRRRAYADVILKWELSVPGFRGNA